MPLSRRHAAISRRHLTRPHAKLAAAVITIATVSLTPGLGSASASAASPPSYVALGDSYTAGPLIPNQQLNPLGCLRSTKNYPHLVAPATALPLRDGSCSGAQTKDLSASQSVTPGPANPPQFDALDASTSIVTIGIGGNDIGFTTIIKDCVSSSPFGTPCQKKYVVNGVDTLAVRISQTGPKIAAALQEIHRRSPAARVFIVGYPAILPETGPGCWPTMPVAINDVPYLRTVEHNLNAMIRSQADANGATYVDTYAPSIGHDACRLPTVRWVEPMMPTNPAAPVHPNARGMQGMAAATAAAIAR
jgi:lysophospholipase L1-like esterase